MHRYALPLRSPVVLPGEELLVECARSPSLALTRHHGLSTGDELVTIPQTDVTTERYPAANELRGAIGVVAQIVRIDSHGEREAVTVRGLERVRVDSASADPATGTISVQAVVVDAPPNPAQEWLEELGLESLDGTALWTALAPRGTATPQQRRNVLSATDATTWRSAVDEIFIRRRQVARGLAEVPDLTLTPDDLWVLQPDGPQSIEERQRRGEVTAGEAADLLHFAEKGYVVWPRLIPPTDVAALLGEIEAIREHPGKYLTTDHNRGRTYRFSDAAFDAYESIFDLYVPLESARRVCFHPKIVRFLQILFDARPCAMQQLLFQRSNGHHPHQDTAYVCIERPMQLAATWVALEDVVAGRGELTYYEGSHRLPHIQFADGTKRFSDGVDHEPTTRQLLLDRCAEHGCTKRDFLAKTGDVFMWAADLVHGSNPRTRPDAETRRSCVTHYCPETTAPLAMRLFPEHTHRQEYGDALYTSQHYRLPVDSDSLVAPEFGGDLPT